MSLKELIRRQKIMLATAKDTITLAGEPLIYSIKYQVGKRRQGAHVFRDRKWRSMLKCLLPKINTKPVVLLIRFYVTPPPKVRISSYALSQEKTPAMDAFEICDYLLSFVEMLHGALFRSYKQICKFDVEKYYSDNPRTVFKFIAWETYEKVYQLHDSLHAQSEGISESGEEEDIQSECERDGVTEQARHVTLP